MGKDFRVVIVTDLEGVSCVTSWTACDPADTTGAFAEASALLAGEINAAVGAAFDAGATEVTVVEGHRGTFRGHFEELDSRARTVVGTSFDDVAEEAFDALMLVGYHAMADAEKGVLSHSYSNKTYVASWLDGTRIGEIGHLAALFGAYGTPLVFVSGDAAACLEAEELVDGVTTAAVKEGAHRFAATCLSPAEARELIAAGAAEALDKAYDVAPLEFEPPIEFVVEFSTSDPVERSTLIPGIEAAGPRRFVIRGESVKEVMRLFSLTARVV